MKTWIASVVALGTIAGAVSPALSACGDKFLIVGRGVRFQRAYAAIHPASILIVVPPKSVKNAAVRDSSLQTALKMAGHRVATAPSAGAADALSHAHYDIVLAERADAVGVTASGSADQPRTAIVGVLEDPSAAEMAAARQQLDAVLKTPQPLSDILRTLDDVMKMRLDKSRP
jgi:hypothetical protein